MPSHNLIFIFFFQDEKKVDIKAHEKKLKKLAEDREKMKYLMKNLDNYKTLGEADQKELVAV